MGAVGSPLKMETINVRISEVRRLRITQVENDTHALWRLNVLHQHDQFLTTDESLESRGKSITSVRGTDYRPGSIPLDVLCLGKQILHQVLLAGKLYLNMALTQTA
jgi:hypothetical protein